MTQEEKQILLKEIPKYIKENCYYTDGSIKHYDLWLVGWVAAEFKDRRNAMRVLINNNLKQFLLSVVTFYPEVLQKAFNKTFNDYDFVFSLIKKNCACLKYLPRKFHSDYKLCLEAVKQEGFSLMYINFDLLASDEIVLAAVSNRGNALSFATPQQKKKREIVYAAVSNCGLALDHADDSWKHDFDLVATAVANRGMALRHAAPELQDNEEIVRIAVTNDGYAIRSASDRLRNNYKLTLLAMRSYPDAYIYLSQQLQIEFRFLPYYIVQRIQKAEQFLYREKPKEDDLDSVLSGEENRFSDNSLSFEQKIALIQSGKIKPVILFFDEINRDAKICCTRTGLTLNSSSFR